MTVTNWYCDCTGGYSGEVYHCPRHAAVSSLYEAVRRVLEDYVDGKAKLRVSTHSRLLNALTEADKEESRNDNSSKG